LQGAATVSVHKDDSILLDEFCCPSGLWVSEPVEEESPHAASIAAESNIEIATHFVLAFIEVLHNLNLFHKNLIYFKSIILQKPLSEEVLAAEHLSPLNKFITFHPTHARREIHTGR
jgi:hypothetical protein